MRSLAKEFCKLLFLGDTHGSSKIIDVDRQAHALGIDTVVQVGDFGLQWPGAQCKVYKYFEKRDRKARPGPSWFSCGGNHEPYHVLLAKAAKQNHPDLISYTPRVHYVRRGTVLNLHGKKIFFFGGAESSDCAPNSAITDTLGRPYSGRAAWPQPYKSRAKAGEYIGEWWPQESPTAAQFNYGASQIAEHAPDIWVTHDAAMCARPNRRGGTNHLSGIPIGYTARNLSALLETADTRPSRWFFGHHHVHSEVKAQGISFYGCGIVNRNKRGPQGWVLNTKTDEIEPFELEN